jgi:DNA uptake protein ComE-like DNA-binding protein
MGRESWAVQAEKMEDEAQKNKLEKINEATVEDLCQIKGIGKKIAKKIIENGPYEEISDIPVNRSISEKLRVWVG